MKTKQTGFTLVELAIAMVIIGLLLAGILKGQELINSGKVKNLGADFRSISTAYYGYQDKFHAIPGDDKGASTHLSGGTVATVGTPGNGAIEGNWNSTTAGEESLLFWQHVRLAGLMPGSSVVPTNPALGDAFVPSNAEGGRLGITSINPDSTTPNNTFMGTFYVCSGAVTGKLAKQLDATMDDGVSDTGSVRVFPSSLTVPATPLASVAVIDSGSYVVCMAN